MSHVGKRIQKYRRDISMSQYELAANICSQSNISKIEKGLYTPSLHILSLLADRLNIPVEYLYSDTSAIRFEHIKSMLYMYLEEQKYEDISDIVDFYPESYKSKYEKKFIIWMKAISYDIVHHNRRQAIDYLKKAENIHPEVEDSELEIGILNLKTIVYRDTLSCAEMEEIYKEVFDKIVDSNIRGKITIKMLLSMSTYCYHKKLFKKVKEYSGYAIQLLNHSQNMYLLDYHLYNLSSALYYLNIQDDMAEQQLETAKALAIYNGNSKLLEVINEFQNKITLKGVSA